MPSRACAPLSGADQKTPAGPGLAQGLAAPVDAGLAFCAAINSGRYFITSRIKLPRAAWPVHLRFLVYGSCFRKRETRQLSGGMGSPSLFFMCCKLTRCTLTKF